MPPIWHRPEAEQTRGIHVIAPPDADDLARVKQWFERLSEHVRSVDFAGATRCSPRT
jgi:hypothetical protein